MRVKAIEKGYYGHDLKMPGEVFNLVPYEADKQDVNKDGLPVGKPKRVKVSAEDQFSSKWMEKIDADEPTVVHQHGAPKGDTVTASKFNPATGDNLKSLDQIKDEHGGAQKGKGKGDDVI